jgi:hypothetical protein
MKVNVRLNELICVLQNFIGYEILLVTAAVCNWY